MASFEVGDWVEIRSTPDPYWTDWTTRHDEFCGAMGEIVEIENNFSSQFSGDDRVKIVVDFQYDKYGMSTSKYYLWFLMRHIIKSDKLAAQTRQNLRLQGDKLQEWEAIKRKKTNDGLANIFGGTKSKSKPKPVTVPEPPKLESPDDIWEQDTDPGIPLPGSTIDAFADLDDDLKQWLANVGDD